MDATLFSKEHIWIEQKEKIAIMGISDYAQEKLGNILFVDLTENDLISIGEVFGEIESVKTVSELISPVSGKIIAVNEELIDEPDCLNEQPYDSWLIQIEIVEKEKELMTENEYKNYIQNL